MSHILIVMLSLIVLNVVRLNFSFSYSYPECAECRCVVVTCGKFSYSYAECDYAEGLIF